MRGVEALDGGPFDDLRAAQQQEENERPAEERKSAIYRLKNQM